MELERALPKWVSLICGITTMLSMLISSFGIFLHLKNYRKPFEQRLIVRILVLVPLFSISCYCMLMSYKVGRLIEPIREIYEAFTIYSFYKLLVLMLGGERKIILMTVDKPLTSHPFPASLFLKKVNISDPQHFLTIKRCILQYVWFKPLLYLIIFITSILGIYDVNDVSPSSVFVWIGICYNISVTTSLYSLAMFWKCLYDQLSVFNPWRKFLCVKLIIFASYWQGVIIGIFNWLGVFKERDDLIFLSSEGNLGIQIQNGLLCFEMIFFALLHWSSFPYTDFSVLKYPDAARMRTLAAVKDFINIGDLIFDIKITTMYGDSYNLRNFDSITDSTVYNGSETFNQKIYQGLRISADGKKYWIDVDDKRNGNSPDSQDKNIDNSKASAGDLAWSVRGKKAKIGIDQSENIENQAKVLLGSSRDGKDIQKVTLTTPLLDKKSDNDSPRRYVSNINDILEDTSCSIFSEEDDGSIRNNALSENNGFTEDFMKDERLYRYVHTHYISDKEINYPVEYEYNYVDYSSRINKMRKQIRNDQGSPDTTIHEIT